MSWKDIYSDKNIKKWGIPTSASMNNQGYARGLILTWTEMQKNFRKLDPPPDPSDNIWYVVCDVLILDDNPILPEQLYLFARRIEIKSDIVFLVPPSGSTSATIVTQEIIKNNKPASLTASFQQANEADDPINVTLTPYGNRAATIFTLNTPSTVKPVVWTPSKSIVGNFGDNLSNGSALRLGLVSTFQMASLLTSSTDSSISAGLSALKTTPKELAINQLEWVAAIADVGAETRVMAGQARTQLSWVVKENQGLVVVPPLDFSIYRDAAIARVKVLTAISDAYDKWVAMKRSNENWLAQAKLTVGLKSNESTLQTNLEERSESKLTLAQSAEAEAAAQLKALDAALVTAKFSFDAGVKIWKRHETITAAFTLALDIIKFGVAVGKLVAMVAVPGAGEAGAAAEAGAASEAGAGAAGEAGAGEAGATGAGTGAASSTEAGSISSQFNKVKALAGPLGEAAGAGVTVVSDVSKIVEIGKTADAMHSMAKDTLGKVDGSLGKTFTISPLKGLDSVTGGKQVWESLKVTMDDMFAMKNDLINSIGGGPDFRVAFRQLVIGAEAYSSTRLAVAEASNRLAEAKLRMNAAKSNLNLVKNYEKEFEGNDALYEQLQQDAFGRVLDAKRAVYLQLEQYQHASNYFTLNKTKHRLPDITASVANFIEESAVISGLELILGELSPIPQTLNSLPIHLPISDKQRVNDTIVVQIDVNNGIFKPYSRIRIDKFAITLLDKNEAPILVKSIKIGTGGLYRDIKPMGGTAQFSGNPFIRTLTYNNKGKVILGSTVYSRFEDVIFKPTPFTTWSFKLPNAATVKNVMALKFTISGAASPAAVLA